MKKALHLVATLLCLLTITVSEATCRELVPRKQSTCDHCPKQSPLDQPACCNAQQQQPSAIVSEETEPQIQLQAIAFVAMFDQSPSSLNIPTPRLTAPPLLPPRTPLRI
jgi:hypothetical protein